MTHMKRWIAIVLLAAVMIAPAAAWAEEARYAVVNNPVPADRLNLRAQPSRDAQSLGKYVNGVCVKVLEDQGEWAHVQVGQARGYMMNAYLADAQQTAVTPMAIQMMVSNPFADAQGVLSSVGNDMQCMILVPNGTLVSVFGFTDEYAHVQYGGVTGYMPLSTLANWNSSVREERQGAGSVMPVPESLAGTLRRAVLVTDQEDIALTDPSALSRLSSLLSSTDYWGHLTAGCFFGAHLLLEYADGRLTTIELATDSCNIYRHDGHDFRYAYDLWQRDEGISNSVLFDLFGYSFSK